MGCGNKTISVLYYFPTEWLMSLMTNVNDHEDESREWIIVCKDMTMDLKSKDATKAHGILKPLQHTQNTVADMIWGRYKLKLDFMT